MCSAAIVGSSSFESDSDIGRIDLKMRWTTIIRRTL